MTDVAVYLMIGMIITSLALLNKPRITFKSWPHGVMVIAILVGFWPICMAYALWATVKGR